MLCAYPQSVHEMCIRIFRRISSGKAGLAEKSSSTSQPSDVTTCFKPDVQAVAPEIGPQRNTFLVTRTTLAPPSQSPERGTTNGLESPRETQHLKNYYINQDKLLEKVKELFGNEPGSFTLKVNSDKSKVPCTVLLFWY